MKRREASAPAVDPATVPRVLRIGLLELWGDRRTFKDTADAWRRAAGVGFDVLGAYGVWSLKQVSTELAERRLVAAGATLAELPVLRAEAAALTRELLPHLSAPPAPPRRQRRR